MDSTTDTILESSIIAFTLQGELRSSTDKSIVRLPNQKKRMHLFNTNIVIQFTYTKGNKARKNDKFSLHLSIHKTHLLHFFIYRSMSNVSYKQKKFIHQYNLSLKKVK